MADSVIVANLGSILRLIDPRRSLATGAVWLIIALAATFSIAAGVWVGDIARETVVEQHIRRLSLETDQLSSDVGQALAARLDAVRAASRILRSNAGASRAGDLGHVFDELLTAYTPLDWVAIADADGVLIRSHGTPPRGSDVRAQRWFASGLRAPWLGVIDGSDGPQRISTATSSALGDLSIAVRDDSGHVVGVVATHLSWPRATNHPQRLTDDTDPETSAQAFLLDGQGVVLVGPQDMRDKPWSGIPGPATGAARFEQLPGGRRVLVSRATLSTSSEIAALGWQVQLSEPNERVYQRADAVGIRIFWASLSLGALTALLGTLAARHLTRRLKNLTRSVTQVGRDDTTNIEVPGGVDEVAQLGRAFVAILGDLHEERRELERRVSVRTHEVQRLAEESRYAAVVRERLKIARDLHDTLAHSMMAILSEIRLLRRLHLRDPDALASELARAEEIAHQGLGEARSAIAQVRANTVRETGLGPALENAFEKFIDRTGLAGEFSADLEAARFGDERSAAFLRIAEEALRNIEKHAMARRATVKLHIIEGTHLELLIQDDGIGFDPQIPLPGHFGLVGLREQAELIGASLTIESQRNEGTLIVFSLPLSPVAL